MNNTVLSKKLCWSTCLCANVCVGHAYEQHTPTPPTHTFAHKQVVAMVVNFHIDAQDRVWLLWCAYVCVCLCMCVYVCVDIDIYVDIKMYIYICI